MPVSYQHSMINYKRGVLVLPRIDDLSEYSMDEPDILADSSVQLYPIGTALITDDGVFRYSKCGGIAVVLGYLLQQAVAAADHIIDLVPAAADAGATSVTVTNGATTALTANMYKDGYLWIDDAAGEGGVYKIKSHPAADTTATCVFTLVDPIEVALTASSKVGLRKNLYDGVIVFPTTPSGVPVGVVNLSSFTASRFGWIKTKGVAAVLTAGVAVVGNRVVPLTTAGAIAPNASYTLPTVGVVMSVGATTNFSLVKLDLDPSW